MANDFSGDTHCKALWKFDDDALTADSKGTNTLTNDGVDEQLVDYKEGNGCGSWVIANTDDQYITDANLNAGFPLKNGDATKVISVCAWIKGTSFTEDTFSTIFSKWYANKASFRLAVYNEGGVYTCAISLGYNTGVAVEHKFHASALSLATWYHITASYNNADKSYAIRVRDTNGAVVGVDLTGTATLDANKLNVEDAAVEIGVSQASKYFDGLMDEMVVFDDIITADEATAIAKGTYR